MNHTIHWNNIFDEMPVPARRTSRLEETGSELANAHAVPAHGQLEPYLERVGIAEKIGGVWGP